jgi:hypothetical protein
MRASNRDMKKRPAVLILLALTLAIVVAPFAFGATAAKPAAAPAGKSPAAPFAAAISTITGIAISPLLGTGAYGAWLYFDAKDDAARAALPWFAQVKFWLPALLIVAVCAAKDAFGAVVPPGWKKPLDVLETIENKASGLVAAGAVVPFTMAAVSKMIFGNQAAHLHNHVLPEGLAVIPVGAMDFSWLLDLLTVPFAVAMFVIVWMASHAINVLILLSPWGAIDAALKAARTALLGLLTVTSGINPWAGAVLSLIVVLIAWFASGWAFRLTHFGTVFSWDWLTRRRYRFTPLANDNRMFAGGSFPGVPPRTYGRLTRRPEGGLEFNYRPWLIAAPKTAKLPAEEKQLGVGRGLFFSGIGVPEQNTLLLLPPRYHGHEETIARSYALGAGVHDAGIRKAWSLLKELFGGAAAQTQVG